MELASMLAGEHFTDHPTSVCDVIASFMRAYNDAIDDERRQDLCPYAGKVLGSRSSSVVREARVELLKAWTAKHRRARRIRSLLRPLQSNAHCAAVDELANDAVRAIWRHNDKTHAAALGLIDELLRLDRSRSGDEAALAHCGRPTRRAAAAPVVE
jgi:hypothetical protein